MKNPSEQYSKTKPGRQWRRGVRFQNWALIAVMAGVLAVQTPCEAKIKWKDVLGVLCTVGGVISGSTGNVPIGVALIGCQGAILSANAVAGSNPTVGVGPDVTPAGLLGTGAPDHSVALTEALLAMNCPDVPVTGTPEERAFISRANVVIGLSRQLRAAPPADLGGLLQQMSVALEEAANACDALGLTNEITQAQWDDFKMDCADGVAPALEEDYLISCGLSQAQRITINLFQAGQRSVLDHRIKYKPGTVIRQAAARFNTNNVGFAGLLHTPVGDASVSQPDTGGVLVQIGAATGGVGGVNIELSGVAEWNGYWSDLDAGDTLPPGAYIESSATGDAIGAITNGPLGSWRMTKLDTGHYVVTADFSPLGATHVTLMVFNGTDLVYTGGGMSGPLCLVNGCVSDDHWGRPKTKPGMGGTLTLRGPTDINVNGAAFVGDRISIVPESAPVITALRSVSITAAGVPSLMLSSETTPSGRIYPGPRWIVAGIPGFAGGCFPGFGICSFSPFGNPEATPVLLSHPAGGGLQLEFVSAQSSASNVFTIASDIPLDADTARELGFATAEILPGSYPVDFSENPFGTVLLGLRTKDISIAPGTGGHLEITWPADGVKVLQTADSLTGPWTDAPVQTLRLRESPSLPSRYYVIKSSK
jgi:hypothetical protein